MSRDLTPDEEQPGSGAVARSLFPAGPAHGRSFIGRIDEFNRLKADILAGRNSWFDCPARYGVNSLVEMVRRELRQWREPRIATKDCRLTAVHDTASLCDALLKTAGHLAGHIVRRHDAMERVIAGLFVGIEKEIHLDEKNLQTIRFLVAADHVTAVRRVYAELDQLAGAHGWQAVPVIYDLQQILALRSSDGDVARLAAIIGETRHATWLLQGSNQHAMHRLLLEKDAPLSGLCRRFVLRPINSSVYANYFADAAQARWKCFIGRKATAMILALTRRHPYWLNRLCQRLWAADLPPVIQNVVDEWLALVAHERFGVSREMERLSPNQRSVLACLAETPTDQPRAKAFVRRTRVSSASVGQAIIILAERDLIDQDADGVWKITDPVIQWSLYPRHDIVDRIYESVPASR